MKSLLGKVKAATDSVSSLAGEGIGAVAAGARITATMAMDAAGDTVNAAVATGRATADAGRSVVAAVDGTYTAARDAVLDAKDAVPVVVTVAADLVSGIAGLGVMGATIGMVAAPVPTVVGLVLIGLIGETISDLTADQARAGGERIERRRFERELGLLRKHGTIPKTSILQSSCVELRIDVQKGTIAGSVLAGEFIGRALEELTAQEIASIGDISTDPDTTQILAAYNRYVAAKRLAPTSAAIALS